MANAIVGKWGNSRGSRLTKTMLDTLGWNIGEELKVTTSGKKKLILERANSQEELTFEELFKNYKGETFTSEITEFEPLGDENAYRPHTCLSCEAVTKYTNIAIFPPISKTERDIQLEKETKTTSKV